MPINRRKVLGGAGLAAGAAATGVGVDRLVSGYRVDKEMSLADDATRFGDPRIPAETITSKSHLFHLGDSPVNKYDGGWFQQADEDNFPILKGQTASIVKLTLVPVFSTVLGAVVLSETVHWNQPVGAVGRVTPNARSIASRIAPMRTAVLE